MCIIRQAMLLFIMENRYIIYYCRYIIYYLTYLIYMISEINYIFVFVLTFVLSIYCLCRSRTPLEPGLKLVVTLRYLATGNSYKSLEYSFRVSNSTISQFIPQVCAAIYEEYREELFGLPQNNKGWRALASEFSTKWNFHHCVGP